MNRIELNNLIKEELSAAVQGHPSYLEEAEDMEAGEMEGGEDGEDIMDSLKDFYEKLKAHFEGEGEDGEEETEGEEEEMEDEEEEDKDDVEEGKKKKPAKKKPVGDEDEAEIALNESVKRFQKLANIRG